MNICESPIYVFDENSARYSSFHCWKVKLTMCSAVVGWRKHDG